MYENSDENIIYGVHNKSKIYPEGEYLPYFVENTLREALENELSFSVSDSSIETTLNVNRMINPFGTGAHVILPKYLTGYRVKSITVVRDIDD